MFKRLLSGDVSCRSPLFICRRRTSESLISEATLSRRYSGRLLGIFLLPPSQNTVQIPDTPEDLAKHIKDGEA